MFHPSLKKPSLSKNEFKNYRPVSNLNYISKLLECILANQIKLHLSENCLFNPLQSAYRSGHSTETALLTIQDDIYTNMSKGKVTALTLLDLSAAFDTIDHSILLTRLSDWFGLGGNVMSWLKSYLTNRAQSIKLGDILSLPKALQFGVSPFSVLGPLLFSLYTAPP